MSDDGRIPRGSVATSPVGFDPSMGAPGSLTTITGTTPVGPEDLDEFEEALAEIEAESIPHEPAQAAVDLRRAAPRVQRGPAGPAVHRACRSSTSTTWSPTSPRRPSAWIALAIAVHVMAYVLQALRWAEVSDTLGIHLPFRRLFCHLLAGEFVSNALPTSVGGDVVRVMRQGRDTGDFADSFASTSLERLTGWLVLPMISMFAMVVHPEFLTSAAPPPPPSSSTWSRWSALLALLWLAGHPRGAGRLVGRTGWRRYLGAVHLGIVAFRHRPLRVTRVIVAGVGFQLLQCVCVWACARALQIPEVTILAAMAFFPPTAVAQNLPFALGGLGVREAMFVLFFGALGASNSEAVGLGLLVYLVFICASLAGAPSFAARRAAWTRRGPDSDRRELTTRRIQR